MDKKEAVSNAIFRAFETALFWLHSIKMQLKYLVKFWLRQSDVMLRIMMLLPPVAVMCS